MRWLVNISHMLGVKIKRDLEEYSSLKRKEIHYSKDKP